MGSSCFLKNLNLADCCSNKSMVTNISKSDQVLTKDIPSNEESKEKNLKNKNIDNNNKLSGILKYFNTEEKEILAEYYKQRDKEKNLTKNRDNGKYELMLKRLLEQQNIKKVGPKRRETIRNEGNNYIKDIVSNLLIENKKNILENKSKNENDTLLIKKAYKQKGRFSVTLDRNILFMNNLQKNKSKIQEQYFKNRKTICEVNRENGASAPKKQKKIVQNTNNTNK